MADSRRAARARARCGSTRQLPLNRQLVGGSAARPGAAVGISPAPPRGVREMRAGSGEQPLSFGRALILIPNESRVTEAGHPSRPVHSNQVQ